MAQRGETEDGLGWGGLVASKAELREERRLAELEKDAARYRWWRKNRETTLVVATFGNGCVNKTIEMVEAQVDAAIAGVPAVGAA